MSISNLVSLTGVASGPWVAKIDNAAVTDIVTDLKVDNLGNIYITGSTGSLVFLSKYTNSGDKIWSVTLSEVTETVEIANGVAIDSLGYIYVTGSQKGNSAFLAKYDSNGTVVWQKGLQMTTFTSKGIAIDSSNNIYIAGTFNEYAIVTKCSTDGIFEWHSMIGGAFFVINSIATNSNALVICGKYDVDCCLIKLDMAGKKLWQYSHSSAEFNSVAISNGGNIYVVGANTISTALYKKFDTNGTLVWQKSFTNSLAIFYQVTLDPSNNLYIAGLSNNNATPKILFIKVSDAGLLAWQRNITISASKGTRIQLDSLNKIYIAGKIADSSIFLAKLEGEGVGLGVYALGGVSLTYAAGVGTVLDTAIVSTTNTFTEAVIPAGKLLWKYTPSLTGITAVHSAPDGSQLIAYPGTSKAYVVCLSEAGVTQWASAVTHLGVNTVVIAAVKTDSIGNVYFLSSQEINGQHTSVINKYSATGTLLWTRALKFPGLGVSSGCMAVSPAGDIAIGATIGDYFSTIRLTTEGLTVWAKAVRGVYAGGVNAIAFSPTLVVYVLGYTTTSATATTGRMLLVKFSSIGSVVYKKVYTNTTNATNGNVIAYAPGYLYIGMQNVAFQTTVTNNSSTVIKVDESTGAIIWQKLHNLTGDDIPYGIELDAAENVYVQIAGVLSKFSSTGTHLGAYTIGVSRLSSNSLDLLTYASNTSVYRLPMTLVQSVFNPLTAATVVIGTPTISVADTVAPVDVNFTAGWIQSISFGVNLQGGKVQVDSAGNIYVLFTASASTYLVKYTSALVVVWQRLLPGDGRDIKLDAEENLFVVGGGNNYKTGYLIKLNKNTGTTLWFATHDTVTPSTANDTIVSSAVDAAGNVYCAGTAGIYGGSDAVVVFKFSSTGTLIWQKRLAKSLYKLQCGGIVVSDAGDCYVAYFSNNEVASTSGTCLTKINADGTLGWTATYAAASGHLSTLRLNPAKDRAYLTCGSLASGYFDMALISFNLVTGSVAGTFARKTTMPNGHDICHDCAVDTNGDIYVVGEYTLNTATSFGVIIKLNSSLVLQWANQFTRSFDTRHPMGIYITNNLIYVVSTYTNDLFTLAVPKDGSIPLTGTYSSSPLSITYSVCSALVAAGLVGGNPGVPTLTTATQTVLTGTTEKTSETNVTDKIPQFFSVSNTVNTLAVTSQVTSGALIKYTPTLSAISMAEGTGAMLTTIKAL
jgi:sugar lactone lactonase YvrE